MIKLNLGSGISGAAALNIITLDHTGWKHIDICSAYNPTECYDISQGIKEDNNSVKEIWMGDFFEHLLRLQAIFVARECYRVLQIGGKVNVCVPNIEEAMRRFLASDGEQYGDLIWGQQDEINGKNCIPDCHKYGYTESSLIKLFKSVGFNDVKRVSIHNQWFELSICATKQYQ